MSHERETETFGKSRHLRRGNHQASGTTQHDNVRVIGHHANGGPAKVAQGTDEKVLAVEALEGRVTLKEQHARVTQHRRGGLHQAFLAVQLDRVRRGIVLQLLTGLEVILSGNAFGYLPDAVTAAEGRQRGIGKIPAGRLKFFMDPDEIAFVAR